ncbi:Vasoactive intestinal polypeptide receptor 2 [Liparis tanakae]|uniref:Vasoactive intestinal polypeptide receptor 2 n=1 Tax=Liparis tanakae TaxID=230148 RepID=A0A4Z2EEU3_9TELE|nr:Vasoactive intestinal polypeptide receptor 2 [Liparis tanakae]
MANFLWLLVEALYLHTLLLSTHRASTRIAAYLLIGWGRWINFLLFVSIVRILVQKLRCTDVGGNERSQYRRLARSTLLLIPLFGVNYVALVSLTEPTGRHTQRLKIFCELGLGSFQVIRHHAAYLHTHTHTHTHNALHPLVDMKTSFRRNEMFERFDVFI